MKHGLSWSAACGIFARPELEPTSLALEVDSLPLSHQGNPKWFLKERYRKVRVRGKD